MNIEVIITLIEDFIKIILPDSLKYLDALEEEKMFLKME